MLLALQLQVFSTFTLHSSIHCQFFCLGFVFYEMSFQVSVFEKSLYGVTYVCFVANTVFIIQKKKIRITYYVSCLVSKKR